MLGPHHQRTSFHHQPEAQHPQIFSYPQERRPITPSNGPGCVKTRRGITTPGILSPVVMRRAKKHKNSSSARHYDQIRFRFHTAWAISDKVHCSNPQVARMRRVNVEGLINTTRTVMKGMRKRRYGRIVNVSSIAAIGTALPGKRRSGRSAQCNICGIHRPATGPSVAPLVPAQAGTRQERRSRRLVASFGSFRPAGVGFDVILRRALDQRHDLILDRFNRGHRGMPLRPVPFDQRDAPMPVVIGAA